MIMVNITFIFIHTEDLYQALWVWPLVILIVLDSVNKYKGNIRKLLRSHSITFKNHSELISVAQNPLDVLTSIWDGVFVVQCQSGPLQSTDLGRRLRPSNCPLLTSFQCSATHSYSKTTFEAFVNIPTAGASHAELLPCLSASSIKVA